MKIPISKITTAGALDIGPIAVQRSGDAFELVTGAAALTDARVAGADSVDAEIIPETEHRGAAVLRLFGAEVTR